MTTQSIADALRGAIATIEALRFRGLLTGDASVADYYPPGFALAPARAALAAHDAAVNAGGWGPANYGDGGIGPYGTPWRFVRDADGSVVAYVEGSREAATARRDRIVACVNACAGIADPAAFIAAALEAGHEKA